MIALFADSGELNQKSCRCDARPNSILQTILGGVLTKCETAYFLLFADP
jgi:hypothetical protein